MTANSEPLEVRDNPAAQRFEVQLDQHLAIAEYRRSPGVITFIHTEVPAAFRGRGVAGLLVEAALDQAAARGDEVVPLCSFVAAYIAQRPRYQTLVPARYQHLLR